MEKLKKFNEFINNSNTDKNTDLFLEGKITIEEWETNFNKINESKIGDLLQSKVFPVLKSIKNKLKSVGQKGIVILKKIFKFIATFAAKYPILAKILVIIIIILIIGVVSASAATGADPSKLVPNSDVLNAAISFIEDLYDNRDIIDVMDKMQVQAYLIDLRNDGVIDENWSEKVQEMGNVATKLMGELKEENPTSFNKMVEFGSEIKDYVFTEIKGIGNSSTNLTLTK